MPAPRSHFVTYRLQWLLCAFVALLLAITLKLTLTQVTDHYQSDTLSTASRLKSQFQQMETFLEAMRGQAEERLRSNPQSALTQQLYGALRENGDQGFALDRVPANLPKGLAIDALSGSTSSGGATTLRLNTPTSKMPMMENTQGPEPITPA